MTIMECEDKLKADLRGMTDSGYSIQLYLSGGSMKDEAGSRLLWVIKSFTDAFGWVEGTGNDLATAYADWNNGMIRKHNDFKARQAEELKFTELAAEGMKDGKGSST